MQNLSMTEKDDLLNGVRDSAVRVHTARAEYVADKSEGKRAVLRAARHEHDRKIDAFMKAAHAGLDLRYAEYAEYAEPPAELEEPRVATAVASTDIDLTGLDDKANDEPEPLTETTVASTDVDLTGLDDKVNDEKIGE